MKKVLVYLVMMAMLFAGCAGANKTQNGGGWGAGIGTVVGAGIGYLVGGKKGAAIGAGAGLVVGGLTGAAIGKYMDKQEEELKKNVGEAKAFNIDRNNDTIEITFNSDAIFENGSATLKPGSYDEIGRLAETLNKYEQCRLLLEGHADSRGSESSNKKLSLARAEAIKGALIVHNIAPARVETIGLGESQPVASNATAEGRQLNRRVVMKIIPIEAQV